MKKLNEFNYKIITATPVIGLQRIRMEREIKEIFEHYGDSIFSGELLKTLSTKISEKYKIEMTVEVDDE